MKSIFRLICLVLLISFSIDAETQDQNVFRTSAITLSSNGDLVFMAHQKTKKVLMYDRESMKPIHEWAFREPPTGLVCKNDKLYVTSTYAKGYVTCIDLETKKVDWNVSVGMGAISPVVTKDGTKLYVCNQFSNTVSEVDLLTKRVRREAKLLREPRTMVLSQDEKSLYVANFLPEQRADKEVVTAKLSVISTQTFKISKHIALTNGSNALRDICLSPMGNYVFVSHNLGRFQVPTSQLQQGWMNTSAISVIRTSNHSLLGSFLVDEPEAGAAGVWGLACDNKSLVVSQSGTHDLSVINYAKLKERMEQTVDKSTLSYDLRFLNGIRDRFNIKGNGPRSLVMDEKEILIPTYFSDTLNIVKRSTLSVSAIAYNPNFKESISQKGEKYFNDASHCFQGWQSCNGCHPGDARTDGLNWDLLNDGIGNPKNCKSMLYAYQTPPSMISGIRADAATAVNAGFLHIQFAEIDPEIKLGVIEYIKSLEPLPSPYLKDGGLSENAKKGEGIFKRAKCSFCHSGPLYTDMKMHKVGEVEFEDGWDTPTLREVWRTAPYLHDGSAQTIDALFRKKRHGLRNVNLSKKEMKYLIEFVNSL
ncbi:hypothetical protein [Flavivirga spongiicola]|uniref:Cytochrome c domain-containing protein n=1 Tax=Flavivirga spongiicola TaxID=421621 RepID=A0ABU7XZB2_9FLAO|nr:hypothetical protein [Flavivirga sp. MEBiC05379]MDO5981129.1 hypothetical protein [Flavivirga sp. MEBiC05379]